MPLFISSRLYDPPSANFAGSMHEAYFEDEYGSNTSASFESMYHRDSSKRSTRKSLEFDTSLESDFVLMVDPQKAGLGGDDSVERVREG